MRIRSAAVMALWLLCATFVGAQSCQPEWASEVVSYHLGYNHQGTDPNNVLGATPSTFHSLGKSGNIVVRFPQDWTTSGDSAYDLCIYESGDNDCFIICLDPADDATRDALIAAGYVYQNGYFEGNQTFCGNSDIDLDAIFQGFNLGDLKFDKLMIIDDGSHGNGAEIMKIQAKFVCTPPPPTPTPTGNCYADYASGVDYVHLGHNHLGTDPNNALGNDPSTYHSLGKDGKLVVVFPDVYSTSGNSNYDLCIDEYGDNDCYILCLSPADDATRDALIAAGYNFQGGYFETNELYCADANIDLDAVFPGFAEGQLRFDKLMIIDDGSNGNGAEIARVEAKYLCPPPVVPCGVHEFATEVCGYTLGANHGNTNPQNALGDTPNDRHSLGDGGSLCVRFSGVFGTTGDGQPDLFIDEYNVVDCYRVLLSGANYHTRQILMASGLTQMGEYFELPQVFCSDVTIDIDAFLPGFAADELRFEKLLIIDDNDGSDGCEIVRVKAKYACPNIAKLGNRVFIDADCDGVQGPLDGNLPDAAVTLYDAATMTFVDQTVTDLEGRYTFCVDPGTYVVKISYDTNILEVTTKAVGGDGTKDSDVDPTTDMTDPIALTSGEDKTDIDIGLCVVCTGPQAFSNTNLVACGPGDPILDVTPPLLGAPWTISIDAPLLNPGAYFWLGWNMGAPIPNQTIAGICDIWLDPMNWSILAEGTLDANSQWAASFQLPISPSLAGFELTFQARVCDPATPGPIAGFPDFFTNAAHIIIGCP